MFTILCEWDEYLARDIRNDISFYIRNLFTVLKKKGMLSPMRVDFKDQRTFLTLKQLSFNSEYTHIHTSSILDYCR